MRGFGMAQPTFAMEVLMDMLAEKLGMDPLELRRKNIFHDGDKMATGQAIRAAGIGPCLDAVAEMAGWKYLAFAGKEILPWKSRTSALPWELDIGGDHGNFSLKCLEMIAQGKSFVIATVVDSEGSVPRKPGAKMTVDAAGEITGSVGGGLVEHMTIKPHSKFYRIRVLHIKNSACCQEIAILSV